MFTGIVEEVGSVKSVGEGRLVIGASEVLSDVKVGDSISVNGACLTVTTHDDASFSVDVVAETLRRTNLGELTAGLAGEPRTLHARKRALRRAHGAGAC